VEEAREQLANAVGARPSDVVFTGGGTESDNLAVKGVYWARRAEDLARRRILASAVEHHAVLDVVEWLAEAQGAQVTRLPGDRAGCTPTCCGRRSRPTRTAWPWSLSCGRTTRWARCSRWPSWPRWRTSTASRCTPTRCRRSARCRSTSRPAGWMR